MRFHRIGLTTASLALLAALAGCGSTASRSGSSSASTLAGTKTTSANAAEATLPAIVTATAPSTVVTVPLPTVQIPPTLPTKLVETTLKPGNGEPAANGDTVVVNYIGVRSKDGVKFDESYSKGTPFPVVLGKGSVIKGWDEGLVGATTGMELQLDIPGDLAYGASGQGSVIGPNEALTFVIDVLAVVKAPNPANAPASSIAASTGVPAAAVVTDLSVGTGAVLKDGQSIAINEVVYRGDTGAQLASTWTQGTTATATYAKDKTLPGLYSGMAGMRIGGRRQITVQAGQALGDANATKASIPVNTTLVFIVDLVAAY